MHRHRLSTLASGVLFFFLVLPLAALRADTSSGAPPDELGRVNFPTSCTAEVQPTIEKAVALLHSFQYTESKKTFADASTHDPKCAIAHWGKAMALFYQLWEFPNDKKLKEGRKDIEKAQKLHSANPREQAFITAAAAFFQKKSKMTHVERIKAYASALERCYSENPGDVEFGSFYALSLVSLSYEDHGNEIADLQKAIAILNPLLQQHPDHPGVAHYMIHATDRPEFAAQGLEAARRYAAIAPDSAHALHMPSHIFVRLGLWQDSIASNIAANASGAHAAGASEEMKAGDRAYLAARTAVELHHWKEAAALPVAASREDWQSTVAWARAIGAARSGDLAGAESDVKELAQLVADREKRSKKSGYAGSGEKATDLREAEAWLAFAKGKSDEALQELRAAADHQDKNGGESVSVPAREMLADMLLELKRADEALSEYKTVLKNSPNRFDALFGAAHAAAYINSPATESERDAYYQHLLRICAPGADRPELSEAAAHRASIAL